MCIRDRPYTTVSSPFSFSIVYGTTYVSVHVAIGTALHACYFRLGNTCMWSCDNLGTYVYREENVRSTSIVLVAPSLSDVLIAYNTLRWQLFAGTFFLQFQCKAHFSSTNFYDLYIEMVQGRLILIFVVHNIVMFACTKFCVYRPMCGNIKH